MRGEGGAWAPVEKCCSNTIDYLVFVLADRTDARRLIGYWHDMSSVCLSVCLWRRVLWLNDIQQKCLNKWKWSAPSTRLHDCRLTCTTLTFNLQPSTHSTSWSLYTIKYGRRNNKILKIENNYTDPIPSIWPHTKCNLFIYLIFNAYCGCD